MTDEPVLPPPSPAPPPLSAAETAEYRRRQAARSRIMGVALVALALLFFFVTLAKTALMGSSL